MSIAMLVRIKELERKNAELEAAVQQLAVLFNSALDELQKKTEEKPKINGEKRGPGRPRKHF